MRRRRVSKMRRHHTGGFTVTDGLIVLAFVLAGLTIMVPKWRVESVIEHEARTMAMLNDLAGRSVAARKTGSDADGDGRGELRDFAAAAEAGLEQLSVSTYRDESYYYALLLPGVDRHALVAGTSVVPADYAEAAFVIVAWPIEQGSSGMRAYVWTEEDGILRHAVDGYPYGSMERPPLPETALVTRTSGTASALRLRTKFWVTPRELRTTRKGRR